MNWLIINRVHLLRIGDTNIIPAWVESFGLCNDCWCRETDILDWAKYVRYGLCMKPCKLCGKEVD
jgi:hypothetical protein